MKAKNMTKVDAIPVIQKMLERGDFGKRKRRALEFALAALRSSRQRTVFTRPVAIKKVG